MEREAGTWHKNYRPGDDCIEGRFQGKRYKYNFSSTEKSGTLNQHWKPAGARTEAKESPREE
jgi:hypothetical protein